MPGVKGLLDAAVDPHHELGVGGFPHALAARNDGNRHLTAIILGGNDGEFEIHPVMIPIGAPFAAVDKRHEVLAVPVGNGDVLHRPCHPHPQALQGLEHAAQARVQLMHLHIASSFQK